MKNIVDYTIIKSELENLRERIEGLSQAVKEFEVIVESNKGEEYE